MKKKTLLFTMMFIAALAFGACSDDDKNEHISVPQAISQALDTKYASATHIEWSQKGNYYVADCRMNGKDMDVWYNAQAEWQLSETELRWNDLPRTVQTTFMGSEYMSWEREDIVYLEYPLQPAEYVIEVEKNNADYQLHYSEEGNLLQAVNVTGKDDTYWPK